MPEAAMAAVVMVAAMAAAEEDMRQHLPRKIIYMSITTMVTNIFMTNIIPTNQYLW